MIVLSGKLSRKIVGMLFVFFLVALSAIAMTLYLSWQLEGVAAAINDAGSQRMRAYRMAHLMSSGLENRQESAAFASRLQVELERFDEVLLDLRQGDPARPMAPPRDADIQQKLLAVEGSWRETVRPMVAEFLGAAPERREAVLDRFDSELDGFVVGINDLVMAMEHSYAANTNLLRSVQAALVLLAALGTAFLIWFLMAQVIRPVSELHAGIRRMGNNDLGVRVAVKTDDEFGGLAKGFNQMAEHLQVAYSTLEERVAEKTRSLGERNQELGMLYEITAFLSEPAPIDSGHLSPRVLGLRGTDLAKTRRIAGALARSLGLDAIVELNLTQVREITHREAFERAGREGALANAALLVRGFDELDEPVREGIATGLDGIAPLVLIHSVGEPTWHGPSVVVARPTVEERVIDIVCENLGVSKEQVKRETSFIDDIGADSLDIVELVMELEDEFDMSIPDEEAEKLQTVGAAVEFIEKHIEAKA